MDVAVCKVLPEEVVKLLLFCRGQGECLGEPCKWLHPSIQVPYGSPCVLCQEEGWFTSPCTGLSEVERDHGQELLPPPPHLQCPDLPPWCQVLHHTQPPLGVQQCADQGGQ